ncbi:DMT family transporter [Mucilaginibacter pedocola]|uniref:Multidrug resistance efflux transporter family protein n=1 Tax=Mucilaginibacter pedocola TaxID=1792845 RepID=A0A1S9PD87_9SPHI|nr:multidrug resistance efflux transporter family protein [Mucilaginibacter pedocola]OOQ58901.1 hypothetical protein BC343_07080 [Mucilaginibacter pedocola]
MNLKSKQAILMGLASALLFSITFIVNRLMSVSGGSWVWSSVLRFYWMLPFFFLIVGLKKGVTPLFREIAARPLQWLLWSTVGFGLFYAPLTFAAAYTPSWLIAGTWQFTIIAGLLVAPFINRKGTNVRTGHHSALLYSGIILLGIVVMQAREAISLPPEKVIKGAVPVLVAAFAYPLGNRKMMQVTNGRLDVYQRILGMVLCSLPFWLILTTGEIVLSKAGPSPGQYAQTLVVAIFSGVLATALFFSATDKVSADEKGLAAVEATQSAEVLFALAGEVILLGSPLPDLYALGGMALAMLGMILHSLES